MKYVKITVDGVEYNLTQTLDGSWVVTNKAPRSAGDYVMTVTFVTPNGQEIVLDTNDEELLKAVTLLVRDGDTESGNRMYDYYPEVIKKIIEFQAIPYTEGFEVDFLKGDFTVVVNNAWLMTMDESRIIEWENMLNLAPNDDDTIEDRRDKVIATIRGKGKLNTALINSIVGAFTNNSTAVSYIKNGTLYVKINAPIGNKQYKFNNVEDALQKVIPAHLGLVVSRNYATWGEITQNFASWETIHNQDNWESLNLYIAPV